MFTVNEMVEVNPSVKSIEISSIEARRFSKPGEKVMNVRIDNNSTVTLINQIDEATANINFRYTASYGGMGVITIEGSIVFECEAADIVERWQKTNNMPNEIANQVHTAIMRLCMPEAVLLSRDIKLPPPIPMPKINIPSEPSRDRKGRRHHGMEVA